VVSRVASSAATVVSSSALRARSLGLVAIVVVGIVVGSRIHAIGRDILVVGGIAGLDGFPFLFDLEAAPQVPWYC